MLEVNLLPVSERKSTQPSMISLVSMALLPLALVSILLPEVIAARQMGLIQSKQAEADGVLSVLQPFVRESKDLKARRALLEGVSKTADELRASKRFWTNDLADFLSLLPGPGKLSLKSIDITLPVPEQAAAPGTPPPAPGTVVTRKAVNYKISGEAANGETLSSFLSRYEADNRFQVTLDTYKAIEDGRLEFGADIALVEGASAPGAAAAPAPGTLPPAPAVSGSANPETIAAPASNAASASDATATAASAEQAAPPPATPASGGAQ